MSIKLVFICRLDYYHSNIVKTEKIARVSYNVNYVNLLEDWIDLLEKEPPPLKNFILPSGDFAWPISVCRNGLW